MSKKLNAAMQAPQKEEETITKMLGAHVDASLYWKFKEVAASRGEQLKDAIVHAALMYISAGQKEES